MPQYIFNSLFLLLSFFTQVEVSLSANTQQSSSASQILDQAVGLERNGRFEAALLSYKKLYEFDLDRDWQEEVLFRTARLKYQLAQYKQSRKFFELILLEYPQGKHTAEAISLLAWSHQLLGDTQNATQYFKQLHRNYPLSSHAPKAVYWLAIEAVHHEDWDLAAEYSRWLVDRLLEDSQENHNQNNLLAKSLCLKCHIDAENKLWEEILKTTSQYVDKIEEGPDQLRLLFWQAEAGFRTQEYDQSRAQFEKLEILKNGHEESWTGMVTLRRAQISARRQQWTEVLKILENFEKQNPGFLLQYEIDYLRGRSLAGRGEITSARNQYRSVIENPLAHDSETRIRAMWMTGETFFHQKNYELAQIEYQKVMQENNPSWQARAALQAGKCLELQENWNEANNIYRSALKNWQTTDSTPMLEARLQWTEKQKIR